MAYNFLYKPYAQGSVGAGKAAVVLPQAFKDVSLVDASGNVVDKLSGSGQMGEGGVKYTGSKGGNEYGQNVYLRVGDEGNYSFFSIPDAGMKYTGQVNDFSSNDIGSAYKLDESAPTYTPGGVGSAGQFTPNQIGSSGFYPAFLGDQYPNAQTSFTDPMQFAAKYGAFNKAEYGQNLGLSQKAALSQMQTELAGLAGYAPAAAALKRSQTALDNVFNQAMRTSQVQKALPGVTEQLGAQGQRAETYAQGRLPDQLQDRALELGVRSQAADRASMSGFGGMAASKASDLMSAQQRLGIAQFGESLLGQNISAKANLLMAPTEYSNAGQQMSVMPSLSGSQLASQNLSELNQWSMIQPTNALSTTVQQQQVNTATQNQFALDKFNYLTGFAASAAGAAQTNANTELQLKLAEMYKTTMQDSMGKTQGANEMGSLISGITSIIGGFFGGGSGGDSGSGGGFGGLGDMIGGWFGGGGNATGYSGGAETVGDLLGDQSSGGGSDFFSGIMDVMGDWFS